MLKMSPNWTVSDAADLYEIQRWGQGYFSINADGNVAVHPSRDQDRSIDLRHIVERAQLRGLRLPILFRFNGILHDRLRTMRDSFDRAIAENDYRGSYRCIYPIKVNQQRDVVKQIVQHGAKYGFGLEAGSKPELLAVVATADPAMPIVCNGFKDSEYIELALLAQKMGRTVLPVVEKYSELSLIFHHARRLDLRPEIGIRVKLATRGSGRWQASGGYQSKFGLTVSELLKAVGELEKRGMQDCFQMLHFHLGSQITAIRKIKTAINEAVRIYVELSQRGVGLRFLDVGGGLGVDYDGSQTDFESSMNYTLSEYAHDVVSQVKAVCDETGVEHPTIMTESGRAVAAYHSVLVVESLGRCRQGDIDTTFPAASTDGTSSVRPPCIETLAEIESNLSTRNLLQSFHDAQMRMELAMNLFSTGHLSLPHRVDAETLFFGICRKIAVKVDSLDDMPEELEVLQRMLADNYFANFSLFQSIPDSWAIDQVFPVMPIHRLSQRPTCPAVISDITCDSDGKIDRFVNRRDVKRTLLLHETDGKPYFLGAFLVGAYQEILGDLHNLFGDTHAVHVELRETAGGDGAPIRDTDIEFKTIVKGDTTSEVLQYVQFSPTNLMDQLQTSVEEAIRQGRLDHGEGGRLIDVYERSLSSYTYLRPEIDDR